MHKNLITEILRNNLERNFNEWIWKMLFYIILFSAIEKGFACTEIDALLKKTEWFTR